MQKIVTQIFKLIFKLKEKKFDDEDFFWIKDGKTGMFIFFSSSLSRAKDEINSLNDYLIKNKGVGL